MTEPTKVDIRAKKSEAEWIKVQDRFWLAATPKIFEWLRWAVILAAVTYVSQKSDSPILTVLVGLCYGSMLLYFQAFFAQFEFENVPFVRSPSLQRTVSILLSALLAFGTYWLIRFSIDVLVANHP